MYSQRKRLHTNLSLTCHHITVRHTPAAQHGLPPSEGGRLFAPLHDLYLVLAVFRHLDACHVPRASQSTKDAYTKHIQ